jgi:hypothetical protein
MEYNNATTELNKSIRIEDFKLKTTIYKNNTLQQHNEKIRVFL